MELIIEQIIDSSVSNVFNAFTDANILSRWFTTNAIVDLRVGGRYSNDDLDQGEFIEIKPDKQLEFTWENPNHCPGSIVKIHFEQVSPDKTVLTLHHSHLSDYAQVNEMKLGWSWAMSNLKMFLEKGEKLTFEEWLGVKNY